MLCTNLGNNLLLFPYPPSIAQSVIGDRQGSNACTIIAIKFGSYTFNQKLDISLLWNELPQIWVASLINSICDGNDIYDALYGDTAVFLDVEDVVESAGTECQVQSANQIFGFNNANNFAALVTHIDNIRNSSLLDHYGVIIACNKSVGIIVKSNGLCALIDSHIHMSRGSGAILLMTDSAQKLIKQYSDMLLTENEVLNIGTLTWIEYL